jgi:hypothetical protein
MDVLEASLLPAFVLLATYSQKAIIKIKSAKIKCFLYVFNSHNLTKI